MPANDDVAPLTKPSKRLQWKEKLFSKDKTKGTSDEQIEDFLNSSSSSVMFQPNVFSSDALPAPSLPNLAPVMPPPALSSAAVDIPIPPSRRPPSLQSPSRLWPSIPDLCPPSYKSSSSVAAAIPPARRGGYLKSAFKSRYPKHASVTFSSREPELIGEGGDDADLPPIEITSFRGHGCYDYQQDSPPLSLPRLMAVVSLGDDGDDEPPSRSASGESRLSFRASAESNSFAQQIRAKMQAEEGRVLQGVHHPPRSSDDVDDDTTSPLSTSPSYPDTASRGMTSAGSPPKTMESEYQAFRPASRDTDLSWGSGSYLLPRSTEYQAFRPGSRDNTCSSWSSSSCPLPHLQQPSLQSRDPVMSAQRAPISQFQAPAMQPRDPFRNAKRAPLPQLQPPAPQTLDVSMSVATPQAPQRPSTASAYDELNEYTSQYMDLFAIKAEESKPLLETSLSEWIRAATWWYLCGKKQLEAHARSRSSSRLSAKLQAVLDLGKALWICNEIVPQHHELLGYGDMSLDTLISVSSKAGDTRLSGLLGQRQVIINHLHSLSVSIKRNNIIASAMGSDHADTSVWVRYPFFAPDVAAVLSGLTSRSMLLGTGNTSGGMMAVGDTLMFFSYGTLFVDVMVSSRDDDDDELQQDYLLPCVLSIIRDRNDWYVSAAITSQNELVNVLVQSDRKLGPTWQDVHFDIDTQSMQIKLPRGFTLDVVFHEDDFKVLWNIVRYTKETEASLQPKAGEVAVFTHILKTLQYIDPGPIKTFPSELTEGCKVRLFERTITLSQSTGTRNAHRGFRLAVVTNSKVKTLSNFQHILGRDAPIVFGLLRGEEGVPALMLKVTEDGRTRSIVLGFHDVDERTTLQSLLLGLAMDNTEEKTAADLGIRSYSIEDNGLQFPAGKVSVIDENQAAPAHMYGPTILSEHLRIFIASEFGSVTDRVNLGMPGVFFFFFFLLCFLVSTVLIIV